MTKLNLTSNETKLLFDMLNDSVEYSNNGSQFDPKNSAEYEKDANEKIEFITKLRRRIAVSNG